MIKSDTETRAETADTDIDLEAKTPRPRSDARPASTKPGDMEALARKIEPEIESRRTEIYGHWKDEPEFLPHMKPGLSLLARRPETEDGSIRPFLTRNRDKLTIATFVGVIAVLFVAVLAI